MAAVLGYPVTRYSPAQLVDFSSKEERKRLSPNSLVLFFNIMEKWDVRDEDARELLGSVTNGPFYEMKKKPRGRVLDADRLYRISYLVGIYKALHIVHGEKLANQWVQLRNRNQMFHGSTPLDYMVRGGLPAMQNVRRLLDARRGGM